MGFWGDLAHFPFWAEVWGTAGQWVSGLATSGAMITAASVFAVDLHRKRRAQAVSVVAWPTMAQNHYVINMHNYSDLPVFGTKFVVTGKSIQELKKQVNNFQASADKVAAYIKLPNDQIAYTMEYVVEF